jgi:hypothetical protein
MLDAGKPERRFSDTRVTLEHECGRTVWYLIDEHADGGELCLPADDLQSVRAGESYLTTILPCIHGCNPHMK